MVFCFWSFCIHSSKSQSAVCMSCIYLPRQTGIYQLLCHYRQAPRFFAPLRMTPRTGCLRSAYLISCFYSSRQAGIYRLLCQYLQAPRLFAPLRMTPRAGVLRSAGLMSCFCLPTPGWYLPTFVSISSSAEILRSAQNDPSGGWSEACRSHVFLLFFPQDRYLPAFVSLSSSTEILR